VSAVVALDVGGTRIKGAVLDAEGNRVTEMRYPTRRGDGPEAVLRRVYQVAAWLTDSAAGQSVVAGGLAVCGSVDQAGLVTAVNLGWADADPGSAVGNHLGIPVAVLNDAHAGALGEGDLGAATGTDDFLYVSLGTSIGAAMVRGRQLVHGAHGHAGELGHITIDPSGPACACGGRGCLQTYMSAAALETRWLDRFSAALSTSDILGLVTSGDPDATGLWEEAIDALAAGLLTVISLTDPHMIVFGGGLASIGEHLTEPLGHSLKRQARPFHIIGEIRLATLGDWSNCVGAAAQARHLMSAPA
jgi:glucokinase